MKSEDVANNLIIFYSTINKDDDIHIISNGHTKFNKEIKDTFLMIQLFGIYLKNLITPGHRTMCASTA